MEMKGERVLAADRSTVWAALNDPEILRRSVPGCETLTPTGHDSYDVLMVAAVGPVKARFKGKLSLQDIEAPTRYRLQFEGQSTQAGFARGEAQVELQEVSTGQTKLVYFAKSQIGGKLAQIGNRLIDAAAGATADKFFENFAMQLPQPTASTPSEGSNAPPPTAQRGGFWRWIRSFWRLVFAPRT